VSRRAHTCEVTPRRPESEPAKRKEPPKGSEVAAAAAARIRRGFEFYTDEFASITRRARWRFQSLDWKGRHEDALERLDLYDKTLKDVAAALAELLGPDLRDEPLWAAIKDRFGGLIRGRHDAELARTFFNSVTRTIFSTVGINRRIEFFHWHPRSVEIGPPEPVFRAYAGGRETRLVICEILRDYRFTPPYQDVERDATMVAAEIDLHLWPIVAMGGDFRIEVIRSAFHRNKAAYLVGRIVARDRLIPLVLPLYNGGSGVFVDTVLLTEAEVSKVFSFAFSSFHVLIDRHDLLIEFLRSILPEKPVAELYNSIGYNRHGKTEFYRDLHRFVHRSKQRFVIAPGKEGAVMSVFTMSAFSYVFKVIKDRPRFVRSIAVTDKTSSRREVMEQYAFVCRRDRVGRLVDTQEFENLRFRRQRFDDGLLGELLETARELVSVEDDHVVLRHLYVQRKVTPLPIFFDQEHDPETLRRTILDFGWFLKDLAASGIFPSDLFNTWNYGVTRRGRVVLFDYDDVIPIESANFAHKPRAYDDSDELTPEEERIVATPRDFFVDEMRNYSGIPQRLKGVFELIHSDLFTVEFWRSVKEQVSAGDLVDITPYDPARKFRR